MEIRHYFAGGNTPLGFYSFYDEILPPDLATRTIYLKGGPGTGKSTFMKTLGSELAERGIAMEFLHCSGDPGSLDGIVSRELGISVIDGTAPHMQDPKLLGAVDEIFDPGRFVDVTKVRPYREQMRQLNQAKKDCYTQAYRYLRMAGTLYGGICDAVRSALPGNAAVYEAETVIRSLFEDRPLTEKRGRLRRAFATAVTPLGVKGYLDTLFPQTTVYKMNSELGVGTDEFLARIADAALLRGLTAEAYYSPLDPARMEHLVLPDLDIAWTTAEDIRGNHTVDLAQYFDPATLQKNERRVRQDRQLLDLLLDRTVASLRAAKEEHARLEEILTPAVDFAGMQDEFSRITRGISEQIR